MLSNKANAVSDLRDDPGIYGRRQKFVTDQFKSWWKNWFEQVFSHLLPFNKWKKEMPNMTVVLVKSRKKYSKPEYRLAKNLNIQEDSDNFVRTVRAGMRPRDKREPALPYKSKKLWEVWISVQREMPENEIKPEEVSCPEEALSKQEQVVTKDAKRDLPRTTVSFQPNESVVQMRDQIYTIQSATITADCPRYFEVPVDNVFPTQVYTRQSSTMTLSREALPSTFLKPRK
jgi:hypothetical protein